VAIAASVSTATVSRCLNFPDQVAKQTRDKVKSAIELLGYSPNFGAKAMATRRTNTIGAIIPTMENAMFARGLEAFQEELRLHGFTMLVASTSYRPEVEEEQIRSLVARGADALLLIGHERDPDIYRFLETQGVPALITWVFDARSKRPSVGFDNRAAMLEMAMKVIEFGHTKLAYISAVTSQNDRASARLNGIQDAMASAGLNPVDLRCIETNYGIEEGAVAFDQLMTNGPRPTSVLCGNDVLAVGALRRARELKIAVPQDVSIIGFDDIELAQVAYPPLTTVHVPHREMGRRAGQILADHVKNGTPLKSVQLTTRPVLRETLAPVKPGSK
jgi:LacI family transcriptional regulator